MNELFKGKGLKSGNSKERMWNVRKVHKPNYTKGAHEMGGGQQVLCRRGLISSKSFTLLTVGPPPASLSPMASIFLSTGSLSAYNQKLLFFPFSTKSFRDYSSPASYHVFFFAPFCSKTMRLVCTHCPNSSLLVYFPLLHWNLFQSTMTSMLLNPVFNLLFFSVCSFEVSTGFDIIYHSLLIGTISSLGSYTFPVFLLPQWLLHLRFPCCLLHTNMVS